MSHADQKNMDKAPPGESPPRKPSLLRHLAGRKYIKQLEPFIAGLRRCHSPHGNRLLYYDDVLTILLLGFFNPCIRSLRKFELHSQVPGVNECLSHNRVCRSTLSDALRVLDPQLLRPLVGELRAHLPRHAPLEPDLEEIYDKIIAFDGSYFKVPAQVFWALQERGGGKAKPGRQVGLDLHFCLATGTPEGISLGGAGSSEAQALAAHVQAEAIYVADRGTFSFEALRAIVQGQGHVVWRLKEVIGFRCQRENPLTDQDRAHGVLSDRVGVLTGSACHLAPDVPVREIRIANPDDPAHPLRLLTDRLDLPAYIIGLIYRRRWEIELFFRWLKVYAHFKHMISHSPRGMETWFYVAVIGTLLMSLYTGQRPNTYNFVAMELILSGQARYEDLAAGLERLARERDRARQRYAQRKAAQKKEA
jgi:hypothetical protein